MLLSNTTLFHPVHAAGTYGYTTLVSVKKKNVKDVSWGKYVQARAFWRNGSYAPVSHKDLMINTIVFNKLSLEMCSYWQIDVTL